MDIDFCHMRTTTTAPYRSHDPLCVDQPGYPHDNECECWCHDEADPHTGSSPSPEVRP